MFLPFHRLWPLTPGLSFFFFFCFVPQQIADLKKENFALKLRIYFLEEKVNSSFSNSTDSPADVKLVSKAELVKLLTFLPSFCLKLISTWWAYVAVQECAVCQVESTVISHQYVQFRAKKKFFTIENYLLVRNFLKHAGFHLFYPLQSFWAKKFFTTSIKNYWLLSEKFLCNTGFPLWFYSLRRVSGLFWAKSIISFFFKFIHWFKILFNEDCPIAGC